MFLIVLAFFIILFAALLLSQVDQTTKIVASTFLTIWFISLSLAALNPFNFYEIRPSTFLLLMGGIISFILGLCLPKKKIYKKNIEDIYKKFDIIVSHSIQNKFLIIIVLIISVYETQFAGASLAFAELYKAAATSDILETKFLGNKIGMLLSMYVMAPIINFYFVIYIYAIFRKVKTSIFGNCVFIYFFCIYCILNGGRGIFVHIAIYFIAVYLFTNERLNLKKLIKPKNICVGLLVGVILFLGMSIMTSYRIKGSFIVDGNDFLESAKILAETPSKYAIVPIELFNYSLENDYVDKLGGYKYGRMTFSGLDLLFTGTLRKIGMDISSTDTVIDYLQENWILCSPSERYNYAYTGFFYTYMDLGIFGVLTIPFILGWLYKYFIIQYRIRPSVPLLCLNCFIFYLMYNSFFSNRLHSSWAMFYIIILLFWVLYNKYKIRNKTPIR